MTVTHAFVNPKTDSADTTITRPTDWNAGHLGNSDFALLVAASNATAKEIAAADYICDGTADDVQINAAAVALPAIGGTIRLSTGTFSIAALINLTLTKQIILQGTGWGTKLLAASDFGTYMIDTGNGTTDMRYRSVIRDIRLAGTGNVAIAGTAMTMRAIRARSKAILQNLLIQEGFHSAISLDGDHVTIEYLKTGGVQYGLYCPAGQSTFGDITVFRSDFAGNSLASVGVQDGGSCSGVMFFSSKLGYAPYGFYREAGTSSQDFMNFVRFVNSTIESYGNAAIFDNSGGTTATMRSVDFDGGVSQSDAYKHVGHGLRAAIIVVPVMLWNRIVFGDVGSNSTFLPGTEGYIKAANLAYNNVVVATIGSFGTTNLFDKVATAALPFWVNASSWNRSNIFVEGNVLLTSQFAAETFTTFQTLLRHQVMANDDGVDNASKAEGSLPIMGVALHAITTSGRVAVQTYGLGSVIVNGTVAAGDPLKPDSGSAGRVIKSTAPGTDRILGRARAAATVGQTVACFIDPSNW